MKVVKVWPGYLCIIFRQNNHIQILFINCEVSEMEEKYNVVFTIKKDFLFQYIKKRLFKKQSSWKLSINTETDIHIRPGFVAVLGESGTGKSTLVSILGGFEKLSKSQGKKISFFFKDKAVTYDSRQLSNIKNNAFGYIFQRCYESKSLNAIDNVAMPLVNRNYSSNIIRKYCKSLLHSLGLSHLASSPANELSGGQLTRIGILRGIAQTPTVLFADEPANNLDEQNAGHILDILQRWQQQTGGTVIMVTHHLNHAFNYADQVIVFQSKAHDSGEIVYYQQKKADKWSPNEQQHIRTMLAKRDKHAVSFPDPPEKAHHSPINRLGFLIKTAWKNIISNADGSRTISMISMAAFALLFFTIFSGNLLIQWFHSVDHIKNNDAFLRKFEIQVLTDPGLSKGIQNRISSIQVSDIRNWLISKITEQLDTLDQHCKKAEIQSPLTVMTTQQIYETSNNYKLSELTDNFKDYSYHISIWIQKNLSIESFNRKDVQHIEQQTRNIIRLLNFLSDISDMPDRKKVCSVFPRWESGPEFVKKNGERRNLTTTIRWMDYRDPFFNDPRLKYIKGAGFRFTSNDDEGIVIDIETLVDDLGYSINDTEVHIIYGTQEITCVPVRAVIEKMPEKGRYHALTTLGFGEKIRAHSHHCEENRRYYQCQLLVERKCTENMVKPIFEQNTNFDQGNIIYNYAIVNDKTIEIYADYQYALTRVGWQHWADQNIVDIFGKYDLTVDDDWEVPEQQLNDPPYDRGTVYTQSAKVVRALGEYLSVGFQELKSDDRCLINAFGYEEKIQFSRQTQSFIKWFQWTAMSLFGFLFILFLCTNMMITIRNKAPEIAIFQAMSGSLLSLMIIYNCQLLILISIAAFLAFCLVVFFASPIRAFFISLVIQSLWNTIDEQRAPIAEITSDSVVDLIRLVIGVNQITFIICLFVMIVTVSMMILYVKFSANYGVSKILKER